VLDGGVLMRHRSIAILVSLLALFAAQARAEQTIVFFRHGEKPTAGLGQLTCQGLNRALALPTVLLARYGTPSYLYAPNPNVKISDPGGSFYYVRPLATLEPVAIRAGLSVNTNVGYNDISGLEAHLIDSAKDNMSIFVAWEHTYLQMTVQDLMNKYGGGVTIPAWPSTDYDSLDVLKVNYTSGVTAQFHHDLEGLNGQPTSCPE
jgi:hypothetical protein